MTTTTKAKDDKDDKAEADAPKRSTKTKPGTHEDPPAAGHPADGRVMCPNCGWHVETA